MEEQRPYSSRDVKSAKDSIVQAQGYKDKGLEAYAAGLNVSSFHDFEGKRVLDLGAGAHLQFARGIEKAGIKAEIVSFSPAFADKKWRENIESRKETDEVVAGMGEQLPFADGSFDRIVSLDVPEHLGNHERYLAYLKEIVRVLAPNGVAYIGPTARFNKPAAAAAIPKEELERILDNEVKVSYEQSHEILKYFTLIMHKPIT